MCYRCSTSCNGLIGRLVCESAICRGQRMASLDPVEVVALGRVRCNLIIRAKSPVSFCPALRHRAQSL